MLRAALVALCCLSLGACATIVAGGPDQIPVRTTPPGAYVYLDGQVVGQTPLVLSLDRDRSLGDIRIYYPGFQPVLINRYKSVNLWVIGNFFLAIFPVIVDIATGNWQRFDDDEITIALTPGQAPPPYGVEPRLQGAPAPQPQY
jgi:hypothetical protein